MRQLTFDVGDEVWGHFGRPLEHKIQWLPWPKVVSQYRNDSENFSSGKVVLEFQRHEQKYYVVECETEIEPVLFVHTGITLSDSKDKPIGFWRR